MFAKKSIPVFVYLKNTETLSHFNVINHINTSQRCCLALCNAIKIKCLIIKNSKIKNYFSFKK